MSVILEIPRADSGRLILDSAQSVPSAFAAAASLTKVNIAAKCAGAAVDAGGFMSGDSDPDGDALSYQIVQDVSHGTLSTYIGGAFEYVPDPDFVGVDRFKYLLWAGCQSSGPYTVTINVNGRFAGTVDRTNVLITALQPNVIYGFVGSTPLDVIHIKDIDVIAITFFYTSFAGVADLDQVNILSKLQAQISAGFDGVVDMNDIDLMGVTGTITIGNSYVLPLDNINLAFLADRAVYLPQIYEFVTRVKLKTQKHTVTMKVH